MRRYRLLLSIRINYFGRWLSNESWNLKGKLYFLPTNEAIGDGSKTSWICRLRPGVLLSHVAKKSLFAEPDNSNGGRQPFAENNTPQTPPSEALLLDIFKQTNVPKNWDRYFILFYFILPSWWQFKYSCYEYKSEANIKSQLKRERKRCAEFWSGSKGRKKLNHTTNKTGCQNVIAC